MNSEKFKQLIIEKLGSSFATSAEKATKEQVYKATCIVIRDLLIRNKQHNNAEIEKKGLKRVYYLCMEFLIGRSLGNNLFNLGMTDIASAALKELGFDLDELIELEADPGLGNGGLGRLAACLWTVWLPWDTPRWAFPYDTTTACSDRR